MIRRYCVFCRSSEQHPVSDGWTSSPLGGCDYWRCPTCTLAERTETPPVTLDPRWGFAAHFNPEANE